MLAKASVSLLFIHMNYSLVSLLRAERKQSLSSNMLKRAFLGQKEWLDFELQFIHSKASLGSVTGSWRRKETVSKVKDLGDWHLCFLGQDFLKAFCSESPSVLLESIRARSLTLIAKPRQTLTLEFQERGLG